MTFIIIYGNTDLNSFSIDKQQLTEEGPLYGK